MMCIVITITITIHVKASDAYEAHRKKYDPGLVEKNKEAVGSGEAVDLEEEAGWAEEVVKDAPRIFAVPQKSAE